MKEKVKSNKKFKLGGSEFHTNVMKISSTHKEMHTVPFYQLDGFEGLIHVSSSQIEAEVQHGILSSLITVS